MKALWATTMRIPEEQRERTHWRFSLRALLKFTFFICILFAMVAALRALGVLLALLATVVFWGVKSLRQRRWGRAATACAVVLFDLCLIGPELVAWWNGLGYTSAARAALRREIACVEFQPNTDWPRYRLDDPDRIKRFKSWLLATKQADPLRSAPPRTACDLKIAYTDGDEEMMRISPFLPAKARGRGPGVGPDVEIHWKDHGRTGDTAALADILSPQAAQALPDN